MGTIRGYTRSLDYGTSSLQMVASSHCWRLLGTYGSMAIRGWIKNHINPINPVNPINSINPLKL